MEQDLKVQHNRLKSNHLSTKATLHILKYGIFNVCFNFISFQSPLYYNQRKSYHVNKYVTPYIILNRYDRQ